MRVGLTENPPWVIRTDGEPAGAEVELMREFASQLGAQPEWHWGGEEKLLGALEHYELDAVVGGMSDETPWRKRIGLTRYYFEEKFDVGSQGGGSRQWDLSRQQVTVFDPRMAGFVRQKGGEPVQAPTGQLNGLRPVAAAEWRLEKMGLSPTGTNLHADRHVIAVPPGENQLVKRLEEFLSTRREQLPGLLQKQPEVPQ
jgi:polar amino acid transport system substrate-binding protein